LWREIRERARLDILKMVVRLGVGVEPGSIAIDGELADDALGRKKIERVVDRGLGDPHAPLAKPAEDLLRRQVLRRGEQQRGDSQTLRRRQYPVLF